MKLSKYFTLAEMTRTSRTRFKDKNYMGALNDPFIYDNLTRLCVDILDPIRERWGTVDVHSGYRMPELNAAVNGTIRSQHKTGDAADISLRSADLLEVWRWIALESGLQFGQCILEGDEDGPSWIHISTTRGRATNMCGQILSTSGNGYTAHNPNNSNDKLLYA